MCSSCKTYMYVYMFVAGVSTAVRESASYAGYAQTTSRASDS